MKERNELTTRQDYALKWIKSFIQKHGLPPTVREIGRGLNIESSSAFYLLKVLQKKGRVKRGSLGARSLILKTPPKR